MTGETIARKIKWKCHLRSGEEGPKSNHFLNVISPAGLKTYVT